MASAKLQPPAHEGYSRLDKIRIQFTLFSASTAAHFDDVGRFPQSGRSGTGVVDSTTGRFRACGPDGRLRSRRSIGPEPGVGFAREGQTPAAVHFAQVNEMDGFFLTGREADPAFTWDKLEGAENAPRSAAASRSPCSSMPATRPVSISRESNGSVPAAPPKSTLPSDGEGSVCSPAGSVPAATAGRWPRAYCGPGRQADRTLRVFQPCGDPRLARTRYGEGVHARLQEDPDLRERDARSRDCQGGEPVFFHISTKTYLPIASQRISSLAAGRRMWRSRARPMRRRWISSNTSVC